MKLRKILSVALAAAMLTTTSFAAKKKYISIGTSSSGSAFSIIGTAMSDVINNNCEGLSANIEVTGGSSQNILLAEDHQIEFAMTASDVLALALEGKGSFTGKTVNGISGVMGGHMTITQVYVLADSPYHSFNDLKGKKISIGASGSVANDAMKTIMEYYGLEINKDWTPEYLSHGDAAEALVDGNVDAVIIMSTLPASPVSTAAASKPIRLLSLDKEIYEKILADCPYYIPASIPANIYNGQTDDVPYTFGSVSMMVCPSDLDEEMVYNVTKALIEHNDVLVKAYPQCDEWSLENATRGFVNLLPMHPGAARYLNEKGVDTNW